MKIGKYELRGELGHGAMGVVHRAWDPLLEREVALKLVSIPSTEDSNARVRFEREARAVARLSHPNIVTLHDYGYEEHGQPYIVMELLRGTTLRDFVPARTPPLRQRLDLAAQVADGLAHAHDRQVVHRDIKPANIFVTEGGQAKITDFGLARLITTPMTRGLSVLGTPEFMSPEQIRGEEVDGRSDIFSLGIVLYWLITNKVPFSAPDLTSVLYRIVHDETPQLEPLEGPGWQLLPAITSRALAKNPGERYQTARELAEALRAAMPPAMAEGSTASLSVPAPREMRKSGSAPRKPAAESQRPGRRRTWLAGALVVGLASLGISFGFWRAAASRRGPDGSGDGRAAPRQAASPKPARPVSAAAASLPEAAVRAETRPVVLSDLSPNSPRYVDIGIAVVDDERGWEYPPGQSLAEALSAERPEVRPRILTRQFVSGGGFAALHGGDPSPLGRLRLGEQLDLLLLVRKRVGITRASPNVLRASVTLEAHLIHAGSGELLGSVVESDLGAGGVDAEAEAQALERILRRLAPEISWP